MTRENGRSVKPEMTAKPVIPKDARCACGKPAANVSPWGNLECRACEWERLYG